MKTLNWQIALQFPTPKIYFQKYFRSLTKNEKRPFASKIQRIQIVALHDKQDYGNDQYQAKSRSATHHAIKNT